LRPYDLILYELEIKVKGKERGLGVYTPDRDILPLCNYVKGSTEFFVDYLQDSYSADTLRNENRLLRIVSADRCGTECFVVEEYLDSDILIPVRNPPEIAQLSTSIPEVVKEIGPAKSDLQDSGNSSIDLEDADLDRCIEAVTTKLEIVMLKSQLLQLKEAKKQQIIKKQSLKILEKKMEGNNQSVAVSTDKAPKAVGPYSQAVVANGFVFVSGCIGFDLESGRIIEGGVEAETRQALENLKSIIEQSGSSLSKVCKTTLMVRELAYFTEVNKIYAEYFNTDGDASVLPARSTFEVSFLPLGAFIEIDAVCII
jgi:2-iminobutanoate/2-iminopropanoate deaminase